jgi:hypothetical protein
VITSLVSMDIWGCNRSKVARTCDVTMSGSRTVTSSVAMATKQHCRYAKVARAYDVTKGGRRTVTSSVVYNRDEKCLQRRTDWVFK